MKNYKGTFIIGIDHGYGNIKTANHIFKTGVVVSDTEPVFGTNVLFYNGRYYLIGEGHKEFNADKITNEEYFILTLAGIAMELKSYGLTEANVHIAAGLPLKWVSQQKKAFSDYLLRMPDVRFTFNKQNYHIRISGVNVFPQGFAAIQDRLSALKGMTVLCDIGNGTMNVLFLKDGKPDPLRAYTEKLGTQQCVIAAKNAIQDKYHVNIDESIIEDVLRTGTADIADDRLNVIRDTAKAYVKKLFAVLRRYDYEPSLMRLYVVGGGGCLIRNFAEYDENRVTISSDIRATAKGYESWAYRLLEKADAK
ncbi:MAG: ParM/StbA family protein [Clostridia bacterium]|nr:ParM/StbA family protein [Clostridia bacterium]